jgi:hypothetical protein
MLRDSSVFVGVAEENNEKCTSVIVPSYLDSN